MRQVFKIVLCCVFLVACQQKNTSKTTASPTDATNSKKFTDNELKQLAHTEFALDDSVTPLIESWKSYFTLETLTNDIKIPDFSFFEANEEAVSELILDLNEDLPKVFMTQSIRSRITIIENMLYKLDEIIQYDPSNKAETLTAVKAVLEAFSNLNFQLNKKIEKDAQKIERPI